MKKLLLIPTIICALTFAHGQTNVSGRIFSNTTWTKANSPYIITDAVVVFTDATLTIEPGVTVKSHNNQRAEIIQAKTFSQSPIVNSVCDGNWSDSSVWSTGNVPSPTDSVSVFHNIILDTNVMLTGTGTLFIDSTGEVCGMKDYWGEFIANGRLQVNVLTIEGYSESNNYTSSYGSTTVNGTWVINSMACVGCLPSCNPVIPCFQPLIYTEGTPVNDTLNGIIAGDDFGCYPQFAFEAMCDTGAFPYTNGVTLAFLITGITGASPFVPPYGTLSVGDTLQMPSTLPSSGYQFFFPTGLGEVQFILIAYGVPATPNQNYACAWNNIVMTTASCNNAVIFQHDSICTVQSLVAIETNFPENPIAIFPNPFSTQTVLQTDNVLHNATLTVDNCFGQTVKQIKNINGRTVVLSRDNLASGLYFLRLTEDNKIFTDKLIITDK